MKKITFCCSILICLFISLLSTAQQNSISKQGAEDNSEMYQDKLLSQHILQSVKVQTNATTEDIKTFRTYYLDTLASDMDKYSLSVAKHLIVTDADVASYASELVSKYIVLFNSLQQIKKDYPSSVYEYIHRSHAPTLPTCNTTPCDNLDFENGTLSGWTGCYAKNTSGTSSFTTSALTCTGPYGAVTVADNDPNTNGNKPSATNQLTIMSGAGVDPISGNPVVCPSGGKYSCRIGDSTVPGSQVAFLENTFTVSKATCNFTYYYSVILQNPGHSKAQQPLFNLTMFDQNGDTIPHCGNYSVISGNGIKGFDSTTYKGSKTYYSPWVSAFVPLQHYIGQCVSILLEVSDCEPGGHFGYAYFDCTCSPLAIISSSPAICGKPITLTAPPGAAAYIWTGPCIVGSTTSQTITVGCAGKYVVIMQSVIGSSCADTLDTVITSSVAGPPVPFFKADTVCVGSSTQFKNLTTPAAGTTYTWNFGDGSPTDTVTDPIHTYATAGTYTVNLDAVNGGCGGDTNLVVVVNGKATPGFKAPPVCLNNPTVFTDTSVGATSWNWNFGEPSSGLNNVSTLQNPSHTYSTAGTFNVTLVVGKLPCTDTSKQTVTVNPLPVANFTFTSACFGQTTTFTDASTIAGGGSIVSWSWNFGDPGSGANNTSTLQNPTHVFSAPGPYSVVLTVTSNLGCQSNITLTVNVSAVPVAAFTAPAVCQGQPMVFTDNSTVSSGTITGWNWKFGDGGTSAIQNPTHVYATAGNYNVTLIVNTGSGCVDSTTVAVTVNPLPTAAFTATTVCQGTATTFTDGSTGGVTYFWEFGDGGTSTLQNPTHTYATANVFNVTEVVTSVNGCKDSITNPVTVNPNPTGTITVPPVCLGVASNFTCTTTMVGGTFAWTFGDGNTSTSQNPTDTYTGYGSYNVSVVLTSASGCTSTVNSVAVVNPIPVADFKYTQECLGHATPFISTSTVVTGTIGTHSWNFGEPSSGVNNTSALPNPFHSYATCGTYNVMLTVTSAAGCSHDTTITITVNPAPVPNFTATSVCQGLVTNFTDASTIACGGTITGWTWNFGDGNTSTSQNPTNTYLKAGTYNVTLIVASNNNCDSLITIPVIVYPLPAPAFIENSPCQGNATNFTDQSTVPGGGTISAWGWSFGDPAGGTSIAQNPSYTYAAAGNYNVTLVVASNHGCIDSITKPVIVNPNPVPDFVADKKQGCVTLCVQFTDSSTVTAPSSVTGWLWNFGDGSSDSSSTSQNPKHCYSKVGVFTVTLTVTTNNGCSETFTRVNYITTWPIPVANFSDSPNPTTDANPTVYFTDQSAGNPVKWLWATFGDRTDSIDSTQNSQHTYSHTGNYQDTGTYNVELYVVNKYGCIDSIIKQVTIDPMWTFYVPNAFTPNGDGMNDYFIGKGVGIINYEMWIFDRWGMQLYHCTDITKPWDGTVQNSSGVQCQEDTYVYLIEITDVFKNNHRYVGRVTIIR